MNLAFADVRHSPGRFVATCVGLGLLLGVVLSMVGIYRGLVFDALVLVRGTGADLWVVEPATRGPFAEASRIPGDTRELVARQHGVVSAGSMTWQSVEVRHRDRPLRLYVIGFEPGRLGGPDGLVGGRSVAHRHELVVDRSAGLAVGERLGLGRDSYTVVGVTRDRASFSGDPAAWMTLRDSQELQFSLEPPAVRRERAKGGGEKATDIVNAVVARLAPHAEPAAVAAGITRWKHVTAMTTDAQAEILTGSVIERNRRQIGMFTTLLLIVSGVVVALIVYTLTMDKVRAIATLKLIGARDRTIVGLIVQQALGMGLIGYAIGTILVASLHHLFPRRVVLEPFDIGALGLLVAVICIVASGAGLRLAQRIDPATALGS